MQFYSPRAQKQSVSGQASPAMLSWTFDLLGYTSSRHSDLRGDCRFGAAILLLAGYHDAGVEPQFHGSQAKGGPAAVLYQLRSDGAGLSGHFGDVGQYLFHRRRQ